MTKSRDLGDLAQTVAVNLPATLGTASQVLQVNSGANGLVFANAAGGGTVQATASGALSNGDTVIVNSNGTVSVVAETTISTSTGTAVVFETGHTAWVAAAYDTSNDKVVVAYTDDANSDYGTAVVGTVSGTSISFGTPVVFESAGTNYMSIAYDSNAGKVVIAYQDTGNLSRGTAIVGTVSGTSISFGSATYYESGTTNWIGIAYEATAQKVVIAYTDAGSSNYGKAVVGTVSGTSISFGTIVTYESSGTEYHSPVYDSAAGKIVIAYRITSNGNGRAIVGTVSGTSISFGTAVAFNSDNVTYLAAVYDANAQKVVIASSDVYSSSRGIAIVGTVSGTSISFGTQVVFETGGTQWKSLIYDASAQKVIIAYKISSNGYGTLVVGTVSGTSISFGSAFTFQSSSIDYLGGAYDPDQEKVVLAYENQGDVTGTSVVFQTGYTSTNLTSENFIGISDAAYSDTATATIQVVGSVNTAQSGLTAGQSYYVQTDGTLSTTADDPSVFAGTAVSSTSIIVKG